MGYIYKITNTQNGKIYIGQTVQSVSERWQKHIICAKRGFNRYLYDAMNHYGYENFSVETVEECDNLRLMNGNGFGLSIIDATKSSMDIT